MGYGIFNSKAFVFAVSTLLANVLTGCASSTANLPEIPQKRFTRSIETLLDGQWEGRLRMREPFASPDLTKSPVSEDVSLRVVIDKGTPKVFVLDDGEWSEVMPNDLTIMRYRSNAIITGFQASGTENNGWVETWSILITVKNDDEVVAEWGRIVNNLNPSARSVSPTFSMGAVGQMYRVKLQ